MTIKSMDMQVVDYDQRLLQYLVEFSDDFEHLKDKEIAAVSDKKLAIRAWQSANSWVGSGAAWGCNVPGVSMDCVGSAIAIVVDAGIVKLPSSVKRALGSARARLGELDRPATELNKRLQAFLMYILLKCTVPGYVLIPVVNPLRVYPLDIFITPYTWSINGRIMLPHAMVCVREQKFLTANQNDGVLQFIDVADGEQIATQMTGVSEPGIAGFALRFFQTERDSMYVFHRDRIVALARQYNKELKGV